MMIDHNVWYMCPLKQFIFNGERPKQLAHNVLRMQDIRMLLQYDPIDQTRKLNFVASQQINLHASWSI